MCFYASQLWCNYSTSAIYRLNVAYIDAYRILHGMTRYHSARASQIYYNIDSFYALQRKITNKFVERCHLSQNLWLKMLMSSDCFYDSIYYAEVESSRTSLASKTSSRTHFEVLGLGLEASSPWPWPRSLRSSKIALSSAQGQHYF